MLIPDVLARFDPDMTPAARDKARRQTLAELARAIPPADRVDHPAIRAAIETYEAARAAELEARQMFVQAEQELPAAQYRDEVSLATARERGRKDPGPVEEDKQLVLIREARRQHGAAWVTLTRSVAKVREAFAKHQADWEASLVEERDRDRASFAALLDEVEAVWHRLQANASNRSIAAGRPTQSPSLFASSLKVPAIHDGDVVHVVDVLAGLRDLAKPEEPKTGGVENLELGADPTRLPLRGSPAAVRQWQQRDEAEARERAAHKPARSGGRRVDREIMREVEAEALEAAR